MENRGRKYVVPVKSLKEQKLPPQRLFDNARGVMATNLAVKIKPKNQFLKMVTNKSWKSPLPVYLVINYGYIFIYTKKESGFVVNVRASGKINKHEDIKKQKPFHDQILILFKHAELKLGFEDSKAYKQWVHLLQGIVHPGVDKEWLKNRGLKLAGYVFSQKEQVTAERVEPPVGQKKDSDWVEVRRYPANTIDLNATVFEETILEDVDDEVTTFSPGRSSTRRDEYEFDLEDDDSDAGSEVFEEEPDFSLDGTDGNQEELSAVAAFLNRTPMTVSGNLAYLAEFRASLARPPATRRSPSRAPSISRSPSRAPSLRSQAPVESLLADAADSRVHHAYRSPSMSRAPSTGRSPSRAPSLRSRVPASPFSLPNEFFSESNEDRRTLYAHPSPSHAPTPAISRTPLRAPTPRRPAAAVALSEDSESFASRGDDPSYVPSEIDSQATSTSTLRSLQARPSFHAPQTPRTSGRPTKKPQIFGRDYGF